MAVNDSLLNVLLVDDEPFIRKGLNALIDWEAEGYCIAGEASNGRNAIQKLNEQEYDLILSDIKMPEMDGIEFITYVKNNKISDAKFVFLSGFYDFRYAKTGIQYGCCDYILKPIQKDELLTALRRIIDEYRREAGREKDKKVYEKAFLDCNLMALIWGKYDAVNLNYVRNKMKLSENVSYLHLELSLRDERFILLSDDKKREQQRKLYHYAGLLLKDRADHIIFDVTKNTECYDIGIIYCDFLGKDRNMSQKDWTLWLVMELTGRIGYTISACFGSKVNGICNISESYREANMMRLFRFSRKSLNNMVITDRKKETAKGLQQDYLRKELDDLIHFIEIRDHSEISKNVKAIYGRMMDQGTDSEAVGLNIQYLLYRLLGLAYELDANINQDEIMQYMKDAVFSSDKIQGNELKFLHFAMEYADYLMQLRQNTAKGTINQIETEIENNYAKNLSLKSLGEKYYINSAYLGQVFKKNYGCTFKDYLNTVRIRKAAETMLRTNKKIYEIAEDVGYKNIEYFINKFEDIYGMTPSRFRKRNLNQ
ncbi:response regulator transcription factor [Anaerocolumna sp. MB42-C2]|uniref:response regulator transcription factor n=1 Tax=Anaerocolumna sp. MB42-C2 TaxID=3070997 RepID=UPI0027E13E72|nr:response regulator transcription factor [Anaerocolumna sp. MB42-C2]WMJ86596.1 response regulator transcription factor [Anaerocolumna sp. MB42-C2]